ncbi:MAG TPA: putative holin-like toxin [Candidatus Ligilactobacillus excrementipullorum]|nr:putative holin-like toxin [Candidatus Ligilactobacillus excrementipullorum]
MSIFETLQLMLATATLIVVLLGLVVELIKLISKKNNRLSSGKLMVIFR